MTIHEEDLQPHQVTRSVWATAGGTQPGCSHPNFFSNSSLLFNQGLLCTFINVGTSVVLFSSPRPTPVQSRGISGSTSYIFGSFILAWEQGISLGPPTN